MIAPVCKPPLGVRVDAEGEEELAWRKVLIVKDTSVVVKLDMVVVDGEELVIAISKTNLISRNNGKKVGLEDVPLVAFQFPPFQLGQHWTFVTP